MTTAYAVIAKLQYGTEDEPNITYYTVFIAESMDEANECLSCIPKLYCEVDRIIQTVEGYDLD